MNPLHLLLVCLAGWGNHHQQHVSEYLQEEVKVLREQLGKRLRLENKIIRPEFIPLPKAGAIKCCKRLGGMLRNTTERLPERLALACV